jgi:hypothetical protein
MSEEESTSGAGKKRQFCAIGGLNDSAVDDDTTIVPSKKVSKSSLIDLTRT